MSRRTLSLGLALVVVAAAAALLYALRPATRFSYGVSAVDGDEAVLLTRRNEDRATYFWIELIRSDGSTLWSTEVSPLQPGDALGFTGIAASADRILVLGERDHRAVVLGLSRATGEKLWDTTLPPPLTSSSRIGTALIPDGPRAYAIYDSTSGETSRDELSALSVADGKILWSLSGEAAARLGRVLHVSLLGPDRLFVRGNESPDGLVLDGATGAQLRSVEVPAGTCPFPGGLVGFTSRSAIFVPAAEGAPLRRLDLDPVWRRSWSGPCGVRGGELIVGLEHPEHRELALERFDPDGTSRWQLSLGERWSFEPLTGDGGSLPRFLPLDVYGSRVEGGPIARELVIVDLDAGTVSARIPHEEQLVVLAARERAYLWARRSRTLVALDPGTGRLESATAIGSAYVSDLQDEDFHAGQLWLAGSTWAAPPELPWAVFDLAAGRAAHVNGGLVLTDVTARGWPGALQQ